MPPRFPVKETEGVSAGTFIKQTRVEACSLTHKMMPQLIWWVATPVAGLCIRGAPHTAARQWDKLLYEPSSKSWTQTYGLLGHQVSNHRCARFSRIAPAETLERVDTQSFGTLQKLLRLLSGLWISAVLSIRFCYILSFPLPSVPQS